MATPLTLLPAAPTPRQTDLSRLTTLVYGPPKIGKSTFASKFPHALFLPTEPGLRDLEVYQAPPDGSGINSWAQLGEILLVIASGQHPFKTLVIDTIDNMWRLCAEHVCKTRGVEFVGDLSYGKGSALLNNEFERVLRKMISLPYGLVLISHSTDKEIKAAGGDKTKTEPTMTKECRRIVTALADMILYCEVETTVEAGNIVNKRVIRTKPNQRYDAGDRTGCLPDTLPLSYNAFFNAYSAGHAARELKEKNPPPPAANATLPKLGAATPAQAATKKAPGGAPKAATTKPGAAAAPVVNTTEPAAATAASTDENITNSDMAAAAPSDQAESNPTETTTNPQAANF